MLVSRNETIKTVYVTPGRDLVADEAQAMRRELRGCMGQKTERLVLDLARVRVIDTMGFETIVSTYNWLRMCGAELIVENASSEMKKIFMLMRGNGRLTISGTGWPF
jgi:anti-anti-sigma factor